MQHLIHIILQYKNYITLSVLSILCFVMMIFGQSSQLGGFRTIVVGGIGWLQSVFSWIPNPIALETENSALRELNMQLQSEIIGTRQASIENERLRKLLDYRSKVEYTLIPADVVGKTTTQLRNYATINRGEKDGIESGMTIVTDAGIVGIVHSTSDNYSLVQMVFNRDVRVAAKVERSRTDAVIAWEGENFLVMKNVPKSADVQVGDNVVTSEYSNRFPSDLPIGKVVEVRDDESTSLFRKVVVKPSVDFNTLEQCFVMKFLPNPERAKLERIIEQKLRDEKKK